MVFHPVNPWERCRERWEAAERRGDGGRGEERTKEEKGERERHKAGEGRRGQGREGQREVQGQPQQANRAVISLVC